VTPCTDARRATKIAAGRARRLRRRLAAGAVLRPAEQAWLDTYEAKPSVQKMHRFSRAPWRRAAQSIELVAAAMRVPRSALMSSEPRDQRKLSWARSVLAWVLYATGHSQRAVAEVLGVALCAVQARLKQVDLERARNAKVIAETDALIARRPTVTLTIEVGSALWCLFDQIDMELDATWHALSYRAAADQVAE
jgi:hypothetical protein